MERLVVRHRTGARAGACEVFALRQGEVLVLGRSPTAAVRFDAVRDDLVSRRHACITRVADAPGPEGAAACFTITDLRSRHGTFLNAQPVLGSVRLATGDHLALGRGGPEIEIVIEPATEANHPPARP